MTNLNTNHGGTLNENIPPEPPAPQYPAQAPAGYGQPQQPYAPPAGYAQQPTYPQYVAYPPQQYAAGQWTYTAAPYLPKSSGYRVASGIVAIVLGFCLLMTFFGGAAASSSSSNGAMGFLSFLLLVAALGNLTSGIVLLAKQRRRLRGAPVTVLSFTAFALLLGLIGLSSWYYGGPFFVFTFLLCAPILIVMGIGLSREKRGL